MKRFFIALQFLTIFPVRIKGEMRPKDFGKSLVYFPLVGMLIGIVLALSSFVFGAFPNFVRSAFVIITSVLITGGLHIDGLADTCDAIGSGKGRDKMLEIMRDSRIGVMGVVGIVTVLLAKFALIAAMPLGYFLRLVIAMAVLSRWMQAFTCYVSQYPRESGKAKSFVKYASLGGILVGGFFSLGIFFFLFGMRGFLLFISSFALSSLFIFFITKKIGGMTGDSIGATSEITEIAVLLFGLLNVF